MITVKINNIDRSSLINWRSLKVMKKLTSEVDELSFEILKQKDSYIPEIADEIEVYEGGNKIFGGKIVNIEEDLKEIEGGYFKIEAQDYSYDLAGKLVAKSYTNQTGKEIIEDLISEFSPSFTTTNVVCPENIAKIVFNQVPINDCLTRLSKIVGYEWYVDANKDIHFFKRFSLVAPFNLTDTNGNYVYRTLKRNIDGTQIVNQVKVRGGMGTETNLYEDVITVKGDDTMAFVLPYKFAGLSVWLDTGGGYVEQTVGIDNIDDFTSHDVLYNYQMDSIRFETALADGDLIKFSGYKKYPVMAIVSDDSSIGAIGLREKLILDNTIENQDTARERAFLELELSKDKITDCDFKTYQSGLETGMRISLSSDKRDIEEMDYIITKIVFLTRTPEEFEYQIKVSTARKMGLTEFLKELARRGDSYKEDDNEVAEIIKTDMSNFQIEESIEAIGANENSEELEIDELIQDSEEEPTWVLSPYTPTSINDTKRAGRLNRSMKLY